MRADPHRGRDSHLFCGMLQYPCYGLIGHWLTVFAGEEILVASRVLLQVTIPECAILNELLGECGRFGHDPFLAALAVLDQNIVLLDILRLHQDHFVAAHPGIEQQHDNGLVPYLQKVLAVVELDHPLHFCCGKGINDGPGLPQRLYLFGWVISLLQIALLHQIIEPGAPDLQQIVDVPGRIACILLFLHQVPKVPWAHILQFCDLLPFQKFQQEPGRCPIIPQRPLCQVAAFTVIQKFVPKLFQTHKKTPFPSWQTTKERVKNR